MKISFINVVPQTFSKGRDNIFLENISFQNHIIREIKYSIENNPSILFINSRKGPLI